MKRVCDLLGDHALVYDDLTLRPYIRTPSGQALNPSAFYEARALPVFVKQLIVAEGRAIQAGDRVARKAILDARMQLERLLKEKAGIV
jgi:hypothetical protein